MKPSSPSDQQGYTEEGNTPNGGGALAAPPPGELQQ